MKKDLKYIIKKNLTFKEIHSKKSIKYYIYSLIIFIEIVLIFSSFNFIYNADIDNNLDGAVTINLILIAVFFIFNYNFKKFIDNEFEVHYDLTINKKNTKLFDELINDNIDFNYLFENYEKIYHYFEQNNFENQFNNFINRYILKSKTVLDFFDLPEFLSLIAKTRNITLIDFFFSIEKELFKVLNITKFYNLKEEIILYEIEEFSTGENLLSENGNKVYLYLKEKKIDHKYILDFENVNFKEKTSLDIIKSF